MLKQKLIMHNKISNIDHVGGLVGWFYGISTVLGYLMSNPFLYKSSVLFQTIQFSMSTQFNCQKHFFFKLFSLVKQFCFKKLSLV